MQEGERGGGGGRRGLGFVQAEIDISSQKTETRAATSGGSHHGTQPAFYSMHSTHR